MPLHYFLRLNHVPRIMWRLASRGVALWPFLWAAWALAQPAAPALRTALDALGAMLG